MDALFLNDAGEPSDRCGPDLTKARPIDEVIADLRGRQTTANGSYSVAFYRACKDSGIDLTVIYRHDGTKDFFAGAALDSQRALRQPRYDALMAHLDARPARREAVIDFVENDLGHFTDNRPFASVEEAARLWLAAGGSLLLTPEGAAEAKFQHGDQFWSKEAGAGWPIKRLHQRFEATAMRPQPRSAGPFSPIDMVGRDELIALIRQHGERRDNGWIVWSNAVAADRQQEMAA